MKIKKKTLSLVLAGALTLGLLPALSAPALADGDSSYTLTVPSTLNVANSGWNATDGISATGTLASGKKLTVTASSANYFSLKSGNNEVGYKLATASTDTGATISWEFTELSSTAATKPMGIIVEDYSTKPVGTYTDTVTFTASVENAVTTKKLKLEGRGKMPDPPFLKVDYSFEIEYTDDDTWADIALNNADYLQVRDGYIEIKVEGSQRGFELKHPSSTDEYKRVSSTDKVSDNTSGYYTEAH